MFDNIKDIVAYFNQLSQNLKTVGILQEPRLAHGTYLIKYGFKSYLSKESAKIIVSQALKTVEQGNVWIYPELMSYIIRSIADARTGKMNKQVLKQLSPKEKKIAKLIANGYSNKDIANRLGIQLATIKKHLDNILTNCI
jgi:two-component system response regulator NreC